MQSSFQDYYSERRRGNQWSDPRPRRRRQEDPESRIRSRSASGERIRVSSPSDTRAFYSQTTKDPPPSASRFRFHDEPSNNIDNEASENAKNRRVQFSRKLEVTRTPPASKVAILRRGQTQIDRKDPTPRNFSRFNGFSQTREPDGLTNRLASSDPPVMADQSKMKRRSEAPPTPAGCDQSPGHFKGRGEAPPTSARNTFVENARNDQPFRESRDESKSRFSPDPGSRSSLPTRGYQQGQLVQASECSPSRDFKVEPPPTPVSRPSYSNLQRELPPTPASRSPHRNPKVQSSKRQELGVGSLSLAKTQSSEKYSVERARSVDSSQIQNSRIDRSDRGDGLRYQDSSMEGWRTSRERSPVCNFQEGRSRSRDGSPLKRDSRMGLANKRERATYIDYRVELPIGRNSSPYTYSRMKEPSDIKGRGSRPPIPLQSRNPHSSSPYSSPVRERRDNRASHPLQPRQIFSSPVQKLPIKTSRAQPMVENKDSKPRTPVQDILHSREMKSSTTRNSRRDSRAKYLNEDQKIQNQAKSSESRIANVQRETRPPSSQNSWDISNLFSQDQVNDQSTPRRSNQTQDDNSIDYSLQSPPRHRSAKDILHDLWRNASPESTESQSEYLIRKYSSGIKEHIHGIPPMASHIHIQPAETHGRMKKRRTPRNSENLPSIPDEIKIGGEVAPPFFTGEESPKEKGFCKFFKKKNKKPPSFYDLGNTDSFNEMDIIKKSTSETDSEFEWSLDRKAAKWNEVRQISIRSDESFESDDNYLISRNKEEKPKKSYRLGTLLGLILLCCIGAGIPIVLFFFSEEKSDTIWIVDESTCVSHIEGVGNFTFSERYTTIRELIMDSSGNVSMIENPDSPQRKSLCWLADFDESQLQAEQKNADSLIQRYTMGVIFFSMVNIKSDDPRSLLQSDFLASTHECDWGVIMCKDPEHGETLRYNSAKRLPVVTALLLADKSLKGTIP